MARYRSFLSLRRLIMALLVVAWLPTSISTLAAAETASPPPPLGVGEPFPSWELEDQFKKTHQLPGAAKLIVFSRSKAADDELSALLGELAGPALRAGELIYLSDISRMPGLVTRLVALPALRDRDYPVVLVHDKGQTERLAAEDGCYTLFRLTVEGLIEFQERACDLESLRRLLTD
ncbi:MAG TPA: hypothetical protein VK979_01130 [Guyparkeria sp.]|nr:hypothetical protein [Guyparkeria sp.]